MSSASSLPTMDQRGADTRVAVLGRYAGVVHVLAEHLRAEGLSVALTWAADDPAATARPTPDGLAGLRLVVTLAPGDPTLDDLRRDGFMHPVVAVAWHPDDELELPPGPTRIVRTGRVLADLADEVRGLATE